MKYIVNCVWGGYCVPEEVCKILHCDEYDDSFIIRTDPRFIQWVEENDCDFGIANIPSEATDWELEEYDGWESIIAVVDGKIVHIAGER